MPGAVVSELDGGWVRRQGRGGRHRLPDPRGKQGIGGIDGVFGDEPGVDEVGGPVLVDVSQGDVAAVGHDDGGVGAVHGEEQGVDDVDEAAVVDVPQQPGGCRRLAAVPAVERFDDEVDRGHAGFNLEGGFDEGLQARSGDRQPVSRYGPRSLVGGGRRSSRANAPRPGLPVGQHHRPGLRASRIAQPVEIDPGANRPPGRVGAVPGSRVIAGRTHPVDQGRYPLPEEVEDLEPHRRRGRQVEGDDSGGIEWIGVVASQVEVSG